MQSGIIRRFALFLAIFVGGLILVVLAAVRGLFPPREAGVTFLGLILAGWVIATILIRDVNVKHKMLADDSVAAVTLTTKSRRYVWFLRALLVIWLAALLHAIWVAPNVPLLPRIVGLTIDVLVVFGLVVTLQKLKNSK